MLKCVIMGIVPGCLLTFFRRKTLSQLATKQWSMRRLFEGNYNKNFLVGHKISLPVITQCAKPTQFL